MDVSLRAIDDRDLPLMLAWAHIDEIWEHMPTTRKGEVLTWEQHLEWWNNRHDRSDYMIEFEGRPVGIFHSIRRSNYPHPGPRWEEVGLYIGEIGLWGKGVGRDTVNYFIGLVQKHNAMMLERYRLKSTEWLEAVIHPDNARSVALFTKAGFKKVAADRNGQDRYELAL